VSAKRRLTRATYIRISFCPFTIAAQRKALYATANIFGVFRLQELLVRGRMSFSRQC
jgi:hypothetical protein